MTCNTTPVPLATTGFHPHLVQLVDGGADGPEHVGLDAADFEDSVENLPVVELGPLL